MVAGSAQLLHQHIGGGGQQHAELVGPEIAATGAVDLKSVQFIDPALYLAASGCIAAWRTGSTLAIYSRVHVGYLPSSPVG